MSFLVNLKLRKKLLAALAPLAFLVALAIIYASYESRQIDTGYSKLIENEITAVNNVDAARALSMRYGFLLYQLINQTDSKSLHVIDGELDNSYSEYKARMADAASLYPAYASQITSASASFNKAVLDSRAVRPAAFANDSRKAADVMRRDVEDELNEARDSAITVSDEMQKAVDRRSEELTVRTHRTILITWLVIGLGMLGSFTFASYLLNVNVVHE